MRNLAYLLLNLYSDKPVTLSFVSSDISIVLCRLVDYDVVVFDQDAEDDADDEEEEDDLLP